MDLVTYLFKIRMRQSEFAKMIGCSKGHLSSILSGKKQCMPKLARTIEEATQGTVTAHEMIFIQEEFEKSSLSLPMPIEKNEPETIKRRIIGNRRK